MDRLGIVYLISLGFVKVIDGPLNQIPDFIGFVSGTDESLKRVMMCASISSIVFDEMLLSSLLPFTSVQSPTPSPHHMKYYGSTNTAPFQRAIAPHTMTSACVSPRVGLRSHARCATRLRRPRQSVAKPPPRVPRRSPPDRCLQRRASLGEDLYRPPGKDRTLFPAPPGFTSPPPADSTHDVCPPPGGA